MLVLHGFPFSNYHNIVKHALMLKGVPFEEHIVYPNTPEMLAVNPSGKVPAVTTALGGNLAESSVILEYLEEAYTENPLYPVEAEARAKVRQLMKVSELYLDLPARRMLPALLANSPVSQSVKDEARGVLERGVRTLNALASFSPYVMGETLTLADVYLRYALAIPKLACPSQLGWDIVADVEGLAGWDAMMADSDISRKIDAAIRENTPQFMAYLAGRSQPAAQS